jgi:hypothetical protein
MCTGMLAVMLLGVSYWVSCRCLFARHTSHVTRHTSHVTRHKSHVTRHTSHVTHQMLGKQRNLQRIGRLWLVRVPLSRHTSHVTRHTSHVTRHTSHVTRHTPHVTRHTSLVIRHTSHVTHNLLCTQVLRRFFSFSSGCPLNPSKMRAQPVMFI